METIGIALILAGIMLAREWKVSQERREWAFERQQLLQRIQAPEQAIVDHSTGQGELTLHIPFDDDEETFLAREQMNGRN